MGFLFVVVQQLGEAERRSVFSDTLVGFQPTKDYHFLYFLFFIVFVLSNLSFFGFNPLNVSMLYYKRACNLQWTVFLIIIHLILI